MELVVLAKKLFTIKFLVVLTSVILFTSGVIIFIRGVNQSESSNVISDEIQAEPEATPLDNFYKEPSINHQPAPPPLVAGTIEAQTANLQKLAMVWGFTKYTHLAFLMGERCWDEELLHLVPIIRFADPDDVNDILYNWFVELGNNGFDNNGSVFVLARTNKTLSEEDNLDVGEFLEMIENVYWLSRVSNASGPNYFTFGLRVDKNYFETLSYITESFRWLHSLEIVNKNYINPLADMGWLTNESFLGHSLVNILSQFIETPVIDRAMAPVSFNLLGNSNFSNQNLHINMDFQNAGYRLLGLFRLWNALKYFSPYIDIIDGNWNEILAEHIPIMLEGDDRLSYELTLMSLASRLNDAHVFFSSSLGNNRHSRFDNIFGRFVPPTIFTEVEGRLVVFEQVFIPHYEHTLALGDVVLKVNGISIDKIVTEMLQYVSYPNEEKALFYLNWYLILRQHTSDIPMRIDVLRGNIEMTLEVETVNRRQHEMAFLMSFPTATYEFLENNIGLINPSARNQEESAQHVMKYFANTDGLIVDLRQYPNSFLVFELAEYLVEEAKHFATLTTPSQSIPGVFLNLVREYSGGLRGLYENAYLYKNNVVILMDERTMSAAEYAVMSLRNGSNVTVMGSNSIGANGNIVSLPLPGRVTMNFSGLGVFTLEGGQTQRIGLSPDIYVRRTIAGIRDGRDELLEAAIEYLLNNICSG